MATRVGVDSGVVTKKGGGEPIAEAMRRIGKVAGAAAGAAAAAAAAAPAAAPVAVTLVIAKVLSLSLRASPCPVGGLVIRNAGGGPVLEAIRDSGEGRLT
jgi:hypothetical protein